MDIVKNLQKQARLIGTIGAVVFAMAVLLLPTIVAASQLTERSFTLSSSSAAATNVSYEVTFTSVGSAGAFVVDFCSNTPVIGQPCTPPTGLSVASVSSATAGFTDVADLDTNTLRVTGTVPAATEITVALDGINNPTSAGVMYARIVTYDTPTNANSYTSIGLGSGSVDDGGAALSITDSIGVSGAVLETMTFCVSGDIISADCSGTQAPVITLGETTGDITALSSSAVSTGTIYTQISTNAARGAVISLKSGAIGCGGLIRSSDTSACDIVAAGTNDITAGQARFGVKAAAASDTGTDPNGILQTVTGSGYNDTSFTLNYVIGDALGITSTFGDPFLDTDGAPANNKNMALTFGASISNSTPAGLYSADLSLIASGKF